MKKWQLGYDLDTLIDWTNKFESYNKYCFSPFSKAKKNGMATSLSKGNLYEEDDMVYEMRTSKTTSKIKMFGAGPEIATVLPNERVITKLVNAKKNVLDTIQEPIWCHIFEEDTKTKQTVLESGFKLLLMLIQHII